MTSLLRMLSHTLSERLAGRLWRTLLVLGLCLGAAAPARALDLWPLLEFSDERQMVLYPLFVREGDFLMLFPFYYRTNEGRDHHVVWPLFKLSDGRVTRVAPVWFKGDQGELTLFPLMRQTPEYTWWSLPPIYTRHDGDFFALYPFYAKSPTMLWVLPYLEKEVNGRREGAIWPLYSVERSSTSLDVEVPTFPLPLVNVVREDGVDEDHYRRTQALLYFRGSTTTTATQTRWQGLFPLAYRWTSDGETTGSRLWVLPYWRERNAHDESDILFPLMSRKRSGDGETWWRDSMRILLYSRTRTDDYEESGSTLLYRMSRRREEKGSIAKDFSALCWMIEKGEKRDATGTLIRNNLRVFPYYQGMSKVWRGEGIDSWHGVFPLWRRMTSTGVDGPNELQLLTYVSGRSGERDYHHGLLPLYYVSREEACQNQTRRNFQLLWPLFGRKTVTSDAGAVLEYSRRFLIFTDERDEDGTRTFRLFGLPIVERGA